MRGRGKVGEFLVAGVELKRDDAAGTPIFAVYARRPPDYAVYRTAERVVVQYADDERSFLP
jgi:hypothetical protein